MTAIIPKLCIINFKGRIPSKKNSRRQIKVRGRTINIPSSDYYKWHKDMMLSIKPIFFETGTIKKTDCVVINFFMPDNRKCDLSNKAESLFDFLVDAKILKDDSWQVVDNIELHFKQVCKDSPGAVVYIYYRGEEQ